MKLLALVMSLITSSCTTEAQDLYGSENVAALTAAVATEAVTRIAAKLIDDASCPNSAPCPRAGEGAKVCWAKDQQPPIELLEACKLPDGGG